MRCRHSTERLSLITGFTSKTTLGESSRVRYSNHTLFPFNRCCEGFLYRKMVGGIIHFYTSWKPYTKYLEGFATKHAQHFLNQLYNISPCSVCKLVSFVKWSPAGWHRKYDVKGEGERCFCLLHNFKIAREWC